MAVALPPDVRRILDDVARVREKAQALSGIGAPQPLVDDLLEALQEAVASVSAGIAAEAGREIEALPAAARILAEGLAADPGVAPNPDLARIAEIEAERAAIREKLKLARRHGAAPGQVAQIEAGLRALEPALRRAALAAARRELAEVRRKIAGLRAGGPVPDQSPGPGAPPKAGGGGAGSGQDGAGKDGGGDEDKAGDTAGGKGAGKDSDKDSGKTAAPKVHTIYVRDDRRVWAWNARALRWEMQDFGATVIEVKLIKGGLLAFSATSAALYDSFLGQWLPALTVPVGDSGGLVAGDAKADG